MAVQDGEEGELVESETREVGGDGGEVRVVAEVKGEEEGREEEKEGSGNEKEKKGKAKEEEDEVVSPASDDRREEDERLARMLVGLE